MPSEKLFVHLSESLKMGSKHIGGRMRTIW
jgi:hypothetical protein